MGEAASGVPIPRSAPSNHRTDATRSAAARASAAPASSCPGESVPGGSLARVTVVVPCYNEAAGVGQLMENLASAARALRPSYDLQFVLVDDGSRDGTWEALHRAAAGRDGYTLLRHDRNRGVAAAIMTGIRHASTEIVCSLDADCTYDFRQLAHMLPLLAEGVDLVTASPYHPLGRVRNVPAWRLFLSRQASFLYRRVMRQKLYTYTSCFRIYRRSAVLAVELDHNGFVGIAELLWRLDREGRRIVEYPAALGARRFGQSKMNKSAAICGHLRLLGRALGDRILHSRLPRKRRS